MKQTAEVCSDFGPARLGYIKEFNYQILNGNHSSLLSLIGGSKIGVILLIRSCNFGSDAVLT